ncbi:MAG: protein phosphatase 2C domain-containing protein [Bifidobacteriaceae bacterium]|nr:protein phosphatase 2C domain-containing protein [Bifidobacteriaceae bacterium]
MTAGSVAAVVSSARTDVGRKRQVNEDSVVAADPVFLVADGMGGHQAGDAASRTVVNRMKALAGRQATVESVKQALDAARAQVMSLPAQASGRAAGTTVSGVVVVSQNGLPYWLVVNIGDSRTYRLSDDRLEQLSIDHSEIQELLAKGQISAEQAKTHPRRNVVTRALGGGFAYDPDYWLVPMEPHDRILICSDGLTAEVPDTKIAELLRAHPEPTAATNALIRAALAAGGKDNVSVVVVDARDLLGGPEQETTQDRLPAVVDDDDDTIPTGGPQLVGGRP